MRLSRFPGAGPLSSLLQVGPPGSDRGVANVGAWFSGQLRNTLLRFWLLSSPIISRLRKVAFLRPLLPSSVLFVPLKCMSELGDIVDTDLPNLENWSTDQNLPTIIPLTSIYVRVTIATLELFQYLGFRGGHCPLSDFHMALGLHKVQSTWPHPLPNNLTCRA